MLADQATTGDNLQGDFVIFGRGSTFSSAWTWDGSSWQYAVAFIGAQLIQAIHIAAITGDFGDLNVSGVLNANQLDADVRNAQTLLAYSGDGALIDASWSSFPVSSTIDGYDALLLLGLGDDRNGWGSASREIQRRSIPAPGASASTSVGWYTIDGQTCLLINVLGSRNVNDDVNLYIRRNSAGTRIYLYEQYSNFRLKSLVGLKTPNFVESAPPDDETPLQSPGTPGTPTLTSRTSGSITLSCSAPTTGGAPNLYRWRYSTNSSVTDSDPDVTSIGPSVTISGLDPNTNYWVDVRGENTAGSGSYSGDLATSTTAAVTPTIVAPTTLAVAEGSTANLNVRLSSQPSSNVIVTATESDTDISVSPSTRTFTPSNWNVNQAFTVSGVSDSDAVDDIATITLTASVGIADIHSVTVTITDDDTALEAPGIPGTPTLTSRTSSSITLATIQGSGGAPTTYRWRYSVNSAVTNTDPIVTSSGTSITIEGLGSDTDYWVDVRAENSAGESTYSGDLATSTDVYSNAPGIPGIPTLTSRTSSSLSVACTPPTTGGTPTSYRWRISLDSDITNSDSYGETTGPSGTISGFLTPDTNYWIDVRAQNSDGNSNFSGDLATSTDDD